MKAIDNTIKYYELLMYYNDTSKYVNYDLPSGFHYELYKDGDENNWVDINLSSGIITSEKKAHEYFHQFFNSFINELDKRCIFIVDDNTNEKVGTVTISLLDEEEYGYKAAIDWFAIKKEYQGKKLSRPLISKFISLANELGHKKIILHTQTTTWLAAKLYLDAGFEPLNTSEEIGWQILKCLTNHEKLINIKPASNNDIYDKRNLEIEKQLNNIYGIDKYNFSVWYKNGLHNIYVYSNGNSYEYEYFEENGKIRIEKL